MNAVIILVVQGVVAPDRFTVLYKKQYNRDGEQQMIPFVEQISNLLVTPPGNLIYHLVLVFSIAGALQAAFNHWRSSEFPQARRTMLGLIVLLLAQLSLFIVSGLGWQGVLDPSIILPPLDRAVAVLSLIWIAWLWLFPEPSRTADAGTILLTLLAATGLALSLVNWLQQTPGAPYNATLQDTIWQIFALAFIAISAIILFIRQPNGWGNGLAMLGLAFLGHAVHLLTNSNEGNYPGLVRLVYLVAYPILLTLPQRFPTPAARLTTAKQEASASERRRYSVDPKTFHALLALAAETDAGKVSHSITRAVAQTMLADLCFLIYLTDEKHQFVIASGYDLIREENLEGASLDKELIPSLAGALQRGRPLRLPASSTSADIKGLGKLLGLNTPGHLMSVPIVTAEKETLGGILLLSPYSSRLWSAEDQAFLSNMTLSLVPIIQRGQRMFSLEHQGQEIQQLLEEARAQVAELERRNDELSKQLEAVTQQSAQDQSQAEKLAALLAVQEESQQVIAQLQRENEELRKVKGSGGKASSEVAYLEKELRLTLEEVAHLQNSLAEANIKVLKLEKGQAAPRSSEQAEVIASISQELRQPMSSIVGYTDLLLGESVGILGALQRKFVERIKASTERIGNLIDDLIQITTLESGLSQLKPEPIDLNMIIDNAMSYTSSQLREKNITLHLDLPKKLTTIHADREALQQILIHLLQNAGAATPVEGTVTLRVQTTAEGEQDYVMIQVSDTGGGILAEDLPRVFSRLYRADNVLIQGLGDTGVGLSIAKTLTEAQQGRIWVDTESGVGSTFSVLLPIASSPTPADRPKRKR